MGRIKILNGSLVEQGTIQDVYSSEVEERINSDYEMKFTAPLTSEVKTLISEDNVAEVDDDYFDIVYFKNAQDSNGKMAVSVESEHVSYRLNDKDYNLNYFTKMGTPTEVLTELLAGTGFTVGTVEFTETLTYSAQEAMSRRALLKGLVDTLGGELYFNKFEVSILARRGSEIAKDLLVDRNIEVLSKTFNKRETDDNGNPLVSYECSLIRPVDIALGDSVSIDYASLDINVELRVVSIVYDPYNPFVVDFEIGNFVPGLEDDAYRIETSTVAKNKLYHGVRIGPENGFEAIRSDNRARAFLNSTNLAFQVGDGTGNSWTNKLYYVLDPETGDSQLIFDGELSAEALNAIKADIDVVVSNTIITNALYASYGRFANLSVNRLDTLQYLTGAPALYGQDLREQIHDFIEATRRDDLVQVQYTNNDGDPLYWTDDTETEMTTEETVYPVMVYQYDKDVKLSLQFRQDPTTGYNLPMIILGEGDGTGPGHAQGTIFKGITGVEINYNRSNDGEIRQIVLDDDGIDMNPAILIFPETKNDDLVAATSTGATLQGISVTFRAKTKVAFDVQIDATSSESMSVLLEARVDGDVHRQTTKYYAGAYKDQIVFNGVFDVVAPGERTVDFVITPSAGTLTIDPDDYRLMLTIRNGKATEAAPYPEINVFEAIPSIALDYSVNMASISDNVNSSTQATLDPDSGLSESISPLSLNYTPNLITLSDDGITTQLV